MNKPYAIYLVIKETIQDTDGTDIETGWFSLLTYGDGFAFHTAKTLIEDPPSLDGNTAIARFLRDTPDEQHNVELSPMPHSTYTHASFVRLRGLGAVIIVGRYW